MATPQENLARFQEISNRGLEDQLDPDKRARFDEAVRRGLVSVQPGATAQQPSQQPQTTIPEDALGALENLGLMARGAIAAPVAGIAGLVGGVLPGEQGQSEQFRAATQEFIGGSPSTVAAQQQMQAVGETLAPLGRGIESTKQFLGQGAQDITRDITGSDTAGEIAGTLAASAPEAILELLGLKGAGKLAKAGSKVDLIPKGTQLIDDFGQPTLALDKALNKVGLTFDNLSPDAKAVIPLRSGVSPVPSKIDSAVKAQIKSGARDDALATLRVVGNKVVDDDLAKEALRQGFDEGLVQMAKTSTPKTQEGMRAILKMVKRIKGNSSLASKMRPSDVAGTSLFNRVKFIRDKADGARLQLDDIATKQLKGENFNPERVQQSIRDVFEKLDIDNLNPDPQGVPMPDFKGSIISGDPSSKSAITRMIKLLNESKSPNALGAHKMKRQLDKLIDFKKRAPGGLGKDGKNALKGVRTALNKTLREISPDYAEVNDVLSRSLTAIDDFEKAVGPSIKVFDEGGNRALGTSVKALFSNRQKRIEMSNAFQQAEDVAKELGGEFTDSFEDLSLFTRQIEDILGPTGADTSFKGEIGSAIKQAGTQGLRPPQ